MTTKRRDPAPISDEIRAAIYVRVSTQGQEEDGTSLTTQEDRCRAYARERGYTVDETQVYREVYSGGELYRRQRLSALRDAAKGGDLDVVICYAVDRLSRDQAHLYIVAEEVERAGARLEFVTENFEQSAVGKFLRSAKAFAGEVEREKIKERSIRGKRARVEGGKPLASGRPPFGYCWRDDARTGYELDTSASPWARRIYEWADSGLTLREIVRRLNEAGVPTPRGRSTHWAHTVVHCILTNPTYAGRPVGFRFMAVKTPSGGTTMRERPREEWVWLPEGTAPELVTWDVFERVQERLHANKEKVGRNPTYPPMWRWYGGGPCVVTAAGP